MEKKTSYNYEELIECGNGKLFGSGNAKLPLPPMLMFDRISEISENKGTFKKGLIYDNSKVFVKWFRLRYVVLKLR